jgi:hypothetical protein
VATRRVSRFVGLLGLALTTLACGGKSDESAHESSAAGGTGTSGSSVCVSPEPAIIDFERTCDSFIPALAPTRATFVEKTTVGSRQAHRFRASDDCGFDLVLALPHLEFVADAEPYELSTWWIQGNVPLGVLVAIVRRPGDAMPLLAVADAGSVDLLNGLLDPLAVSQSGPQCPDAVDLVQSQLTRDAAPLACEDEAPGLRVCHDGLVDYRLVDYAGPMDSSTQPAVMGEATLLIRAP